MVSVGLEIERKFRVTKYDPGRLVEGVHIRQGYFGCSREVRVRIAGLNGTITIKGEGTIERREFEYAIPPEDAKQLLQMTDAQVEKARYKFGTLQIDVFAGRLRGLVLAEVELKDRGERIEKPTWLEWEEVTGDDRFLNRNLARHGIPQE